MFYSLKFYLINIARPGIFMLEFYSIFISFIYNFSVLL